MSRSWTFMLELLVGRWGSFHVAFETHETAERDRQDGDHDYQGGVSEHCAAERLEILRCNHAKGAADYRKPTDHRDDERPAPLPGIVNVDDREAAEQRQKARHGEESR